MNEDETLKKEYSAIICTEMQELLKENKELINGIKMLKTIIGKNEYYIGNITHKRFTYIKNSSISQYQSIPIQKIGKGKAFHCQGLVDELISYGMRMSS